MLQNLNKNNLIYIKQLIVNNNKMTFKVINNQEKE